MPDINTSDGIIRVKNVPSQSNTLGAIGTALGGTALLGVGMNAIGNTFSRYMGNIGANIGALSGTLPGIAPAVAPFAHAPFAAAAYEGGFVSKEVAHLMAENAQLKAEKYADRAVSEQAERISGLERAVAVTAARDEDFRRYVEAEFVHQPKATFASTTITTATA